MYNKTICVKFRPKMPIRAQKKKKKAKKAHIMKPKILVSNLT